MSNVKDQQVPVHDAADKEAIHADVRNYYGARAQAVAISCCEPGSDGPCCDQEAIGVDVRDESGARAQAVAASCCEPGAGEDNCCDMGARLYSAEELAQAPEAAGASSLGCGNPTALASLRPGEVVVDLGAGGGLDAFLASRRVGPDGFVYGVDMTDAMLDLARRNAARGGFTNVEFRKGQIEDLPLPDATADVIISNCVINLSPDKGQTLHEALRVLKPGGRLAVSDIVIDGDLDDLPVSEGEVRAALRWAGCIAGALTIAQFRELLAEAGFGEIDIEIKHRYRLEDLGQDMESVAATLSPDVAAQLVSRFVSANISAVRLR
ncbi:MAG: arsenite methyltransferase [Caldilineaceae bacterium]|nr:arsenite methyltransferase [Caldilineaceae bacterium]